jgi:hypothetical protein
MARVAAIGVNVGNEKDLTHCDSALKHFHEEAGRRTSVKRKLCEGSRRPSPSQVCKEVVHDRRGKNGLYNHSLIITVRLVV